MRAAYAALVLGLIGGLGLATVVLSGVRPPPATVAAALGLDDGPSLDARRGSAVAALTAACMRRSGVAWLPVAEPLPSIVDASLDPVAWADRWGFGVSTVAESPAASVIPDPNLEALDQLPSLEQAAVRAALHGSASQRGCAERATDEVYGLRDRALAPLRADLERLAASIEGDRTTAAATASWRGCMAAASGGLPLDRGTLAAALLRRAVTRLEEVRAGRADLMAIQRQERQTAGVLARCEAAYADARARVATRYEPIFVARHRDQLEAIGAAIRSAESAWPSAPP